MAERQKILICGLNWIGDTIMSMPVLQVFRKMRPDAQITLLVKPSVKSLWSMSQVPDELIVLSDGGKGTWRAVRDVARKRFDVAYILPNSFRSALIPFAARIPKRAGMPGHSRDWMLTEVVQLPAAAHDQHQSNEYATLLLEGNSLPREECAKLTIAKEASEAARASMANLKQPIVGFVPGAARGTSKRWPLEHFVALGKRLVEEKGCGIAIFGSAQEREVCDEVAMQLGSESTSFAGRTSFETWVAGLDGCQLVIANDSGGMHVAAATGTPVVALYGITDPAKTGPMGPGCTVLQKSPDRSRDVARESSEAQRWLEAITPDEAFSAALDALGG